MRKTSSFSHKYPNTHYESKNSQARCHPRKASIQWNYLSPPYRGWARFSRYILSHSRQLRSGSSVRLGKTRSLYRIWVTDIWYCSSSCWDHQNLLDETQNAQNPTDHSWSRPDHHRMTDHGSHLSSHWHQHRACSEHRTGLSSTDPNHPTQPRMARCIVGAHSPVYGSHGKGNLQSLHQIQREDYQDSGIGQSWGRKYDEVFDV